MSPLRVLAVCAVAALAFAGCSGQAGVSNMTDNFSYGGQAAGKDGTETYTWHTTGTKAIVSWGGQATSGSFTITIQDSAGKSVYAGSMGAGQNAVGGNTASGTTGDWTIVLVFRDFTGQMGLNIVTSGMAPGGSFTVPTYPVA